MGRATRARGDEGGAVPGAAGDAVDARGVDGFGEGHRQQNGGEPPCQPRLARPGRADEENVLVSDGYAVYRQWMHGRQTCLAPLIRRARGLSERQEPGLGWFGRRVLTELQRLVRWAQAPLTAGAMQTWYARTPAREMGALWTFVVEARVDPTNNRAERALRFAVLWRRIMQGTSNAKGDRWAERILWTPARILVKNTWMCRPAVLQTLQSLSGDGHESCTNHTLHIPPTLGAEECLLNPWLPHGCNPLQILWKIRTL
jgi:hypothetical protein